MFVVAREIEITYANTLENSEVGDMTKLSFEVDHEIRCWILWSSSILRQPALSIMSVNLGEGDTVQSAICLTCIACV